MQRPDIWSGKELLFLRTAQAVVRTQEALPQLSDPDRRRMTEVSDIFYRACWWKRWLAPKSFRVQEVPEFAMEAYQLARDVEIARSSLGPVRCFTRMHRAVITLNAAIVGQKPDARAVADCANLCREFGEYLAALRARRSRL